MDFDEALLVFARSTPETATSEHVQLAIRVLVDSDSDRRLLEQDNLARAKAAEASKARLEAEGDDLVPGIGTPLGPTGGERVSLRNLSVLLSALGWQLVSTQDSATARKATRMRLKIWMDQEEDAAEWPGVHPDEVQEQVRQYVETHYDNEWSDLATVYTRLVPEDGQATEPGEVVRWNVRSETKVEFNISRSAR